MNRIQEFGQRLLGIKKQEKPKADLVPFTSLSAFSQAITDMTLEAQMGKYKSWVYAAVTKIAHEIANTQITLNKMNDKGEVEELKKHPVLDLLDKVNPFITYYDLAETTTTFQELTGNAYWWLIKDSSGKIAEIYPWLRPDRMITIPSPTEFIKGYKYHVPGSQEFVNFSVDEIIHFKYLNPFDPYTGMSPVRASALAIGTDEKSAEYNYRFFGNKARPDFAINFKEGITNTEAEQFRTQWENAHGEGKEHRMAIMSKGEVVTFGLSQKDMEFLKQREFGRDEILAIFKVPKALLDPQELNFASAKVAKEVFLEETIVPKLNKYVNMLNEFLLPHFGDDRLFFDFVSPMAESEEAKLKRYETLSKVGAIAPNEVREDEGLVPYEGGDNIYLPANMLPVGTKEGQKIGTVDRTQQVNKKKFNIRKKTRSTMAEAVAAAKEIIKNNKTVKVKKKKVTPQEKEYKDEKELLYEHIWKTKIQRTDVDEREMRKLLREEFNRQEKQVLRSLTEKQVTFRFDEKKETEIFIKVFAPFITQLIKDYGEDALVAIGLVGYDLTTAAREYIKTDGLKFAKDVNETTKEKLNKQISEGVKEGEGIPKIRKRVSNVFTEASRSRAFAIARTEVAKSSNFATTDAWIDSGVVKGKTWITALDERVCPICNPLHGKTIGLTKDYKPGDELFGDVREPPAHVSCRCTLIAVTKSKSEELMELKEVTEEVKKEMEAIKDRGKEIEDVIDKGKKVEDELKETVKKVDEIIDDGQEEENK